MLTKKQLASRWEISTRTIDRMVMQGRITPVRIGRSVRFREDEIEDYEREHTQTVVVVDKRNRRNAVSMIV